VTHIAYGGGAQAILPKHPISVSVVMGTSGPHVTVDFSSWLHSGTVGWANHDLMHVIVLISSGRDGT
jgi:hypothetical protein